MPYPSAFAEIEPTDDEIVVLLCGFRFDMKGDIMTDMTLPRPKDVPPLDFETLAAKVWHGEPCLEHAKDT